MRNCGIEALFTVTNLNTSPSLLQALHRFIAVTLMVKNGENQCKKLLSL